jgi:4-aminobutyrate aminotransferase-like enzyme
MTTQPKQTTRSEEVVRKHKEYLWPAVTNFYKEPLVADHGSMQHVWDVEGKKYLDFFGGILTVSVGHANPKITGPVKAQVDRFQHLRWPCRKSRFDHAGRAKVQLFHQFGHRGQ